MNRHSTKSPDGGPASAEVAARVLGTGGGHARGGRVGDVRGRGRYDVTEREDKMPLAPDAMPEAHGGHYYTPEDREKYGEIIGYDKGLAPGYDPMREKLGADDERGKYEIVEFTPKATAVSGAAVETRAELIKRNRDGSRSIVCVYAKDPAGNVVKLPPDTRGLKAGWAWANKGDLQAAAQKADEHGKRDEELRQEQAKAKPAPAPARTPIVSETPEQKAAREARDPALQAERHGESKAVGETYGETDKADKAGKDKK